MSMEAVMFESPSYRERLSARTDVLDKVKALTLLPDGLHVTRRMVADYFEVGPEAVKTLVRHHRAELEASGYRVLAGQELGVFKTPSGLDPRTPGVGVFPRRAVLNVAMLLRESEVARSVRRYLLDAEQEVRAGSYVDYEELVGELERRLLAGSVAERLARCEGMLLADRGLTGAMSLRLCEAGAEVRALRADLAELRRGRWVWRR